MENLTAAFEDACKTRKIPGAVLMAWSKSGLAYENAFGVKSIEEGAPVEPLRTDNVFWIASCTKLMTSIAALQCVERGLIALDDDVSKVVPELNELGILTGFDDKGTPITEKRKNPIKFKHLLSHQSGIGYDAFEPKLMQYRQSRGEQINGGSTVLERHMCPLLFEPGTSWKYSPGLDFAGLVIERLSGTHSLDEYMKQNLWEPLGIKDITFWPEKRPDLMARLSGKTQRDPEGSGKVVYVDMPIYTTGVTGCFGGAGCFAALPDYMKILKSLLLDDEKLLKKETAALLFRPQLSKESHDALDGLRDIPGFWNMVPGTYPRHVPVDYGCGGLVTLEDDPGWRKKDTLIWSGLPNLFWWIDRETGLCGIYGEQVFPPGDDPSREMITLFEKAMYAELAKTKSNL